MQIVLCPLLAHRPQPPHPTPPIVSSYIPPHFVRLCIYPAGLSALLVCSTLPHARLSVKHTLSADRQPSIALPIPTRKRESKRTRLSEVELFAQRHGLHRVVTGFQVQVQNAFHDITAVILLSLPSLLTIPSPNHQ